MELQPKFGIQLGIPILMVINLGECGKIIASYTDSMKEHVGIIGEVKNHKTLCLYVEGDNVMPCQCQCHVNSFDLFHPAGVRKWACHANSLAWVTPLGHS